LEKTAKQYVFSWPTLLAATTACIVCLTITLFGNEVDWLLYIVVFVPVVSVVVLLSLVIRKRREQRITTVAVLIAYVAVTALLFMNSGRLRSPLRWSLWSQRYKAELLAQPEPANGTLRHVEADGWGGLGAGDTVAYLVFDPTGSLSMAAEKHSSGKFRGLPCEVPQVNRVESNWFSVVFYTDTDWEHCREAVPNR
jgi:hypothetical protein